jgi:hypothetical protein
LRSQLDTVLAGFRSREAPKGVNPSLILRIKLAERAVVEEANWERCGLTLLSVDQDRTLVLFSSDQDLKEFSRRLNQYRAGPPREGQRTAPHSQIFACIEEISEVRPQDRVGRVFRAEGLTGPEQLEADRDYVVDIELWDLGARELCRARVGEMRKYVESRGGQVTDDYIGESLVLLRATCSGKVVGELLGIDSVATVDLPPQPALSVGEMLDLAMEDVAPAEAPPDGAPGVAILDSGLASGHPLLASAVGESTTAPLSWGDGSDGHGHGTMVAGLALYGDVEACIQRRSFVPEVMLYSARVLNDKCRFDDETLITTQMREAIEYFSKTYGCRAFNVSLGDARLPYGGGKVLPWACILDTLARELDVVIVVSAGNYQYDPGPGGSPDGHVQQYPRYLLRDDARIVEPATGAIVLTVGALSHAHVAPKSSAGQRVSFRPIALRGQPSPFTRSGPGLGEAIKPELCELGGNVAYDGLTKLINDGVHELSVVSLNREYIDRLFRTDVGTSFAAPRVAHMAARLFDAFPHATANLVRALLAASASVPEPASEVLAPLGRDAVVRVCGYGRPDLETARSSEDNRVVLYAQSEIAFDDFHVYEVPVPEEFIAEGGTREVAVTLAFDPPVRHSRLDYLGGKMSYRLIRGCSLEEVVEAFRQRSPEGDSDAEVRRLTSTRHDCDLLPGAQAREGGTLQKGVFQMRRAPRAEYGDTYYLVVRSERKWARDEQGPQRYAVVVEIRHSAQVSLYNRIRQRVTARVRL